MAAIELSELTAMARLLEAESATVRDMVREQLLSRAENLEDLLPEAERVLTTSQFYAVREVAVLYRTRLLIANWPGWLDDAHWAVQLETAMAQLGRIQNPHADYPALSRQLDDLTAAFYEAHPDGGVLDLNRYLFQEGRLQGCRQDYYNPANSNLNEVLLTGSGLPISLALIFILCGYRLGMDIRGFNFPGHFLACAPMDGDHWLFDCFNRGKVIQASREEALTGRTKHLLWQWLERPPRPEAIVARVLTNLFNAYLRLEDFPTSQTVQRLRVSLKHRTNPPVAADSAHDSPPRFSLGQLVRHKRYGYRGVVVDLDRACRADEDWYQANRSQPVKNQPWYHVLVHDSDTSTYAAQTSLTEDSSVAAVTHPLIDVFFESFADGAYTRNAIPYLPW